jgi:hypothetical protein
MPEAPKLPEMGVQPLRAPKESSHVNVRFWEAGPRPRTTEQGALPPITVALSGLGASPESESESES